MTRRVTDGLIILAVLALGASHLWAQGLGGRQVVRPNQSGGARGGAMHGAAGPTGGAAMGGHAPAGVGGGSLHGPGGAPGGGAGNPNHAAGGAIGGPGGPPAVYAPSGVHQGNPQHGPGGGVPNGACRSPAVCR